MTSLEFCHELEFSKINFIERKVRITHPKTILYGPPKSGKSYLIYDYLSNFDAKDYLYIDLNDFRNDKQEIINNLEEYTFRNKIKVIVLENFDFDFKIPFCESVIISTNKKQSFQGFKNIYLTPLDFEEFLLHENKNHIITQSFNYFFKYGNLPQTVKIIETQTLNNLQELLLNISKDSTSLEILKILLLNIDEKKSLNQLYLVLKNKIKISKDRFYEECKHLEESKIIFFIAKYNQEKNSKKIYAYNQALFSAITHEKRLKSELTNIILLELINKYKDIYYLDYIDFYIPSKKSAYVSIPFFNSNFMQNQVKKINKVIADLDIKELTIITISNNEEFVFENMKINVLPFYEWALS
ncbi:MAG: ATP-binding protein [Halarcobacter sp.]